MKPTTYLATVSELNEELVKQRAIKEDLAEALEILHEALRSGPPEVIGLCAAIKTRVPGERLPTLFEDMGNGGL